MPEDTWTLPSPHPMDSLTALAPPQRGLELALPCPLATSLGDLGHRVLATQSLALVSTWTRMAWGPV